MAFLEHLRSVDRGGSCMTRLSGRDVPVYLRQGAAFRVARGLELVAALFDSRPRVDMGLGESQGTEKRDRPHTPSRDTENSQTLHTRSVHGIALRYRLECCAVRYLVLRTGRTSRLLPSIDFKSPESNNRLHACPR